MEWFWVTVITSRLLSDKSVQGSQVDVKPLLSPEISAVPSTDFAPKPIAIGWEWIIRSFRAIAQGPHSLKA